MQLIRALLNCNKDVAAELIWKLSVFFNAFNPEFMKWTFPSLILDMFIVANRDVRVKNHNRMANSVDPD